MNTATVIPFPVERLGDPADLLFVALMESGGRDVPFGEVVELAARRAPARQDNRAAGLEQTQTA